MKNKIASIYFDKEKTYLTITECKNNSVFLMYLNSTQDAIDLNNIASEASMGAIFELFMMAADFVEDLSQINITLHPEYIYATTFPGEMNFKRSELENLLNLEILVGFENKELADFNIKVIENYNINNTSNILIAEIIPLEIKKSIEIALNDFGVEIHGVNIKSNMLNVASAFIFNYPEHYKLVNMLVIMHQNMLEFVMLFENKILSYEFATDFGEDIAEVVSSKINQIMFNTKVSSFSNLYFLGAGLNKSTFLEFGNIAALFGAEIKRLNPFRMLKTNFEQREREYCSRVFHLYAGCIGAAFTSYFNYKKLEDFV